MKPTDGKCQTEIRFRVKVSSPENTNVEGVDSFHMLEDRMIYLDKVRDILSFRGLSPWYGTEWKSQELGRACISSTDSRIVSSNPERRGRGESMQAVGSTHSRGVAGVMFSESFLDTRRGWQYYARIKGDIIYPHRGVKR